MGFYDFLLKYDLTFEEYIEMLYEIRSFFDFNDNIMEQLVKTSDSLYDDEEYKDFKNYFVNNKNKGE